jgi:endo-1,4-beta-xylanase
MLRDLPLMARLPIAFTRPSWPSTIARSSLARGSLLARCSLLALCVACSDGEGADAPPMPGAPGATLPPDAGGAEPVATAPLLLEAESAQLGADVSLVTDGPVTFVTAAVNLTDAPASLADTRVASTEVVFPAPGEYEIYTRFRLGPNGPNDDSFFIDTATSGEPTWEIANGLQGYDVAGEPGHQPAAIVTNQPNQVSNGNPGVWKWGLLDIRFTVLEGALTRTFSFATREDGLEIDKFAFAIVGNGYTTGFTTPQLDAGEPGVVVFPPPLPPAFEPPATQTPLASGQDKWLGMVCCGNQSVFLENYFNQVVPENGGKWGSVEATRDVFTWDAADEAIALAEEHGFPFRYHVLLWGSQQPDWIETLPPEEQLAEIREWFEAVSERYGSRLDLIEVVNEFDNQPPTADNEGNYVDALGGAGETGYDWILNAFRMAREIFPPTARLMINEYSVTNTDARTDRYLTLVGLLRQEALIDALGDQVHAFSTTGPVEQMVANLDRLGTMGLPIYLTEMDIDGPEMNQLVNYQRLFPAFWEHPSIRGITLWGYRDGMWRQDQQAQLVYSNGAEKPAMRWLKGYLRGTAPVVAGPTSASLASSAPSGTEVATLSAAGPGGAALPSGAAVAWGVADGTAAQAVAFAEGTSRLELTAPLLPGTYQVRVYADVDATVSDLYTIDITIE